MSKLNIFGVITLLFLIIGCNKVERTILDLDTVKKTYLGLSDKFLITEIINPRLMDVIGDNILMTHTKSNGPDKVYYLYDKNTMGFKGDYIFWGRGADEVFSVNAKIDITSDSTFINRNNAIFETEYLIKDGKISVKSERELILGDAIAVPARMNEDRYLATNLPSNRRGSNNTKNHYSLFVKNAETGKMDREYIKSYPKFHRGSLTEAERISLYLEKTIATGNNFYSFYLHVPIIRKFDKDANVLNEYILKDYVDYWPTDLERIIYYLPSYKYYSGERFFAFPMYNVQFDKIFVRYRGEFLVFDLDFNLKMRLVLDKKYSSTHKYTFDDEYIYLLDDRYRGTYVYKFKYS